MNGGFAYHVWSLISLACVLSFVEYYFSCRSHLTIEYKYSKLSTEILEIIKLDLYSLVYIRQTQHITSTCLPYNPSAFYLHKSTETSTQSNMLLQQESGPKKLDTKRPSSSVDLACTCRAAKCPNCRTKKYRACSSNVYRHVFVTVLTTEFCNCTSKKSTKSKRPSTTGDSSLDKRSQS